MAQKSILATYSPEDVTISIAGLLPIEGYLEGTFISISREAPFFTSKESADGVVSRVASASKTYNIKLSLHQASESNLILSRIASIDNSTHILKFPIMIKDHLGSTMVFSTTSWIENAPETTFSTGIEGRTWEIKCANAALNVGGNSRTSTMIEDAIGTIGGLLPRIGTLF